MSALTFVILVSSGNAQSSGSRPPSDSQRTTRPEQENQDWNYDLQPGVDPDNRLLTPFLDHLSQDQKHFWT
ncbi:MAG: hypothetical protein DMG97_00090, partial [Acidobacteria bacterium]